MQVVFSFYYLLWFILLFLTSFTMVNTRHTHTMVNTKYTNLFDAVRNEAPEKLDMDVMLSYPKFRNIFHDSFERLAYIPYDEKKRENLQYYTLACADNIGKNSYQNQDTYQYQPISLSNAHFSVGVKSQDGEHVAYNQVNGNRYEIKLFTIDTKVEDYGMMVKKGSLIGGDAKVVFRYKDEYNFYYARLTNDKIQVVRTRNGKAKTIKSFRTHGERVMYILLEDGRAYVYVDWKYVGTCIVKENSSTICGLMFRGDELSEVDDIVVERFDSLNDNGMESVIETGQIKSNQLGSWQTEEGLITACRKHTNGGAYSLRFELDYFDKWEPHKVANSRRTEICPKAVDAKPLDSWINSFDIYFPGLEDGNEYYKKDNLYEVFWQSHDNGAATGLSPHLAMYLRNDVISFQTLSRAILRYDNKDVKSNTYYKQNGLIATLVDDFSSNVKGLELKKGEWHNFTVFIREGYTAAQLPRTIVYVDGKKVIDWFHPNAYNCGPYAEYLKMGVYKWPWAKDELKTDVRKRVIYYDNIKYLR